MRLSLTIGCLLSLALSALATTNYVAVTGSDGAAGTLGAPWRTLDHAGSYSAPGDTVLVQPGIWNEFATLSVAGVTLRANGAVTNRGTLYITKNNVVVDGLEMTGDGGPGNVAYGCVVFPPYGVTNSWVINNKFHDTPDLYPYGPVCFIDDSSTNTCQSCVISNNLMWNASFTQVAVKGDGHLVVNNWISNTWGGDLFNVQGNNHVFRGNFATQVGDGILAVYGCGSNNFNGTYMDNPVVRNVTWANQIGYWTNATGGTIVETDNYAAHGWNDRFNIVDPAGTHVYASAPTMDGTWTMRDSSIGNPPTGGKGSFGHADFVEAEGPMNTDPPNWALHSTNVLFENNIDINSPLGSPFMAGANDTNYPGNMNSWIVRNNVFAWTEVAGGCSIPNTLFLHNTYYQCSTNDSNPITFTWYYNPTNITYNRGTAFNCQVKSNAFVGCGNSSSVGWYSASAAGQWTNSPGFSDPNYIWTDPTKWPMVNVLTNCDYNYVGGVDGSAKESDSPNYPTTSVFKFSEPHGTNGGNVFINPALGIWAFTNAAGTVFGANLNYLYAPPTNSPGGDSVTNGLVLRYTFDTITPTNVPDWTGNGHPGWNMQGTNWITPTNGVFGGKAGYWVTNGVASNGAQAYLVSTYLAVTNLSGLTNMPGFSLSVWTKTKDIPPDSAIMAIAMSGYSVPFSGNAAACSNSWDLRRVTSSEMQFIVHTLDDDHLVLDFPCDTVSCNNNGDLTQTNYHHYGVSFTNGTFTGYHDGVPFQTNTLAVPYLTVYGGPGQQWLCIGADSHNGVPTWGNTFSPNDAFYAGAMDDFRIFNRALSPSEFAAIYAGSGGGTNTPPPPPPLTNNVLLWIRGNVSVPGAASVGK